MKKVIFFVVYLILSHSLFSQELTAFHVLFDDKVNSVNENNIDEVYNLIIELDKSLKESKKGKLIYEKGNLPFKNPRIDEIDNILNQIKENLTANIEKVNNSYNLVVKSSFDYSNTGPLDSDNYRLEIVDSNLKLNSVLVSMGGFMDLSTNDNIKFATRKLNYQYALDQKPSKIDLTIKISAFTDSKHIVISKKDAPKAMELNNIKFELINFTNTHLALKIDNLKKLNIYPFKDNKIASFIGLFRHTLYKEIYDYLINTETVTKESLSNRFPIEAIKAINVNDKYKIIVPSDQNIEDDILLLSKNFKSIEVKVQKDNL